MNSCRKIKVRIKLNHSFRNTIDLHVYLYNTPAFLLLLLLFVVKG